MGYYIECGDFDGPEGIEKVMAYLTVGHLDCFGGYPYDWIERDGEIIIAALDDSKDRNRTIIEVYDIGELRKWEERAKEYRDQNPEECWEVCVGETRQ